MDITQVPVGFGMALAMNESAMDVYAAMTQQQKQAILTKAHNAKTKKEMHQVVSSIAENR